MKFKHLIESIIMEATPEQIYNSYYKDIPFNTFRQIVLSDPGTLKNDKEIKKIGKYSKLLLMMFKSGNLKTEDLPKATEYLSYVYKHNVPIDITKLKTLSDLYNIVKQYYTKDTKDLKDVLMALSPNDYETIFQDEKWTVLKPKTEKGACYLGVNTQWCTTWGPMSLNPDYKDRSNQYENYSKRGPLYIVINNSDLNEKYQLHFESKQYMNIDDKRFDTGKFFEENDSIKNFFFPSFVNPNLDEDSITAQIDRMNVLSSSDSTDLIERILEKSSETNKLISSIINKDEDEINKLIVDNELGDDTEISGDNIVFTFKTRLTNDLDRISDLLSYYENDKANSWERVYDDISNEDEEWKSNRMEGFFKQYYDIEKEKLNSIYGIMNYEQFKSEFFEDFLSDNGIYEEINNEYSRINGAAYESEIQSRIDDIERYISFGTTGYRGYTTVDINIGYFLLFLTKKNIQSISNNLEDILVDYSSFYDFDHEYEGIFDYGQREVKYEEVSFEIEKYFDAVFDEYEQYQECNDLRIKLKDTIQKIFKGETTFENDIAKIEIPSLKVDCENETVFVKFTNKQTGKTEEGNIKIENLPSYATNYKLFENVLRFKKHI